MSMDDLNAQVQGIWEGNAAFWDSRFGDTGNDFHRTIIEPSTLKLLALQPGESVLEIACGNGAFARTLARLGAHVTATDFSSTFIERAKERSSASDKKIDYEVMDATDEAALLTLGTRRFDAAVCNMALMDMSAIEPLFLALRQLLKPAGRFVFSIMHPCFNSMGATKMAELVESDGEITTVYVMKVSRYLTPFTERGIGIIGQPAPHYYFHRPLSLLLHAAFAAGFALNGLEEPNDPGEPDQKRWTAWENFKETPPALIVRLRVDRN